LIDVGGHVNVLQGVQKHLSCTAAVHGKQLLKLNNRSCLWCS